LMVWYRTIDTAVGTARIESDSMPLGDASSTAKTIANRASGQIHVRGRDRRRSALLSTATSPISDRMGAVVIGLQWG
jgi:hypothetical protein